MSEKHCWKLMPMNGYDIPAIERYLENKATQGWLFSMTVGPLTVFQTAQATELQFHLEPMFRKSEEDAELNALYEAAGWRYLGIFRSCYYVFATSDMQAQAHTDTEARDYA